MSAAILRRAAADMREKAERYRTACDETSPEIHGGPDAHWSHVFLASAILQHPHVIDDDPDVVRVVRAGAESLAPWHPGVALAVAEWLDLEADRCRDFRERFGDKDAWSRFCKHRFGGALAVARAYLGETDGAA